MNSSNENIEHIKNQNYFWKYNLKAIKEFITKENINNIIKKYVRSRHRNSFD